MSHPGTHRATIQPRLVFAAAVILVLLAVAGTILSTGSGGSSSTCFHIATATAPEEAAASLWDGSATPEFFLAEDSGCPPARGVPAFPDMYTGIIAAITLGGLAYLVRKRLLANE